MKPRKFRLHFNKVNMLRGKRGVWTVHLSDRCIQTKAVFVNVPVWTVFNKTRQPFAYMTGFGRVRLDKFGTVTIGT